MLIEILPGDWVRPDNVLRVRMTSGDGASVQVLFRQGEGRVWGCANAEMAELLARDIAGRINDALSSP